MIHKKRALPYLLQYLVIVILFTGCIKSPQSISSKYEILPEKPDGYSISKRVLLVADNQLNHLYGDPTWLRNELFDKVVSVAIRPVQQDLFGQDLLKWTLTYYGKRIPVVHLGDGTNMACLGELKAFQKIMSTAKKPWFMAPGNHDAYLLGNLHAKDTSWKSACVNAEGPTTKDLFAEEYLKHLKKQHNDFGKYLDQNSDQGEWRSTGDRKVFLRAVAWKIDKEHPYRSYVVQELDLGRNDSDQPISAIVMDSSQYKEAPTLVPLPPISYNAGISGSMLKDQLSVVDRWLQKDPTGNKLTVLMVHHPYADLVDDSKKTIDSFREKFKIQLYISGHTHHGEFFVRGGDNGWLELNIGSIVDWPIEFRTFEIHEIRDNPDNLVFRTPLFRIPDIWGRLTGTIQPKPDTDWEITQTNAKDFYLAHNYRFSPDPQKTQQELLVALLHTYRNLITQVRSAGANKVWLPDCSSDTDVIAAIDKIIKNKNAEQMTSFLIALADFDRNRKSNDPIKHRDYRLYQALWASKYDKLEGRKPIVSDPYIRFPKGGINE